MTSALQEVRVQVPAPPSPPATPVNPAEINARIEAAVERALSDAGVGQRENIGENIRQAVQQVQEEIAAARAQGVERITIQPQFGENVIPPQAVDISVAFFVMVAFIIVGLPLARAFARRMDRRGEPASASEITPRLERIEQAIEAIAIEVERVSEGQRYTTKAISDLRGLPSANASSAWPSEAREPERIPLGETSRRP
jgi:hypothetical protein